jgi:proteasome accessory factor B
MSRGEPLILVLKVLRHLQASHQAGLGVSLEELAEACGVSTRTVRRKVRSLQEAGIPVKESSDDERRRRYTLDHRALPAAEVSFEPFEAAALFVAEGMMAAMEGLPLAREARAALEKAQEGVPIAFRNELQELVEALHGSLSSRHAYAPFGRRFVDLVDSIGERWPVTIAYRSLQRDEARSHLIHPYLFHCQSGTVYLVARRPGGDRFLTFALDRIDAVEVHDEQCFQRETSFNAAAFVAQSFGGYHEGEVEVVRLHFASPVARVIRERTWHESQELIDLPYGGVEIRFRTAGPTGVLHWAKAFLPHVRIVEPSWLAERQRQEAQRWLEALREVDEEH